MTQPRRAPVEYLAVTTLSIAQVPMTALSLLALVGALAENSTSGMLVFTILALLTVGLTVVNIQIISMRRVQARGSAR